MLVLRVVPRFMLVLRVVLKAKSKGAPVGFSGEHKPQRNHQLSRNDERVVLELLTNGNFVPRLGLVKVQRFVADLWPKRISGKVNLRTERLVERHFLEPVIQGYLAHKKLPSPRTLH